MENYKVCFVATVLIVISVASADEFSKAYDKVVAAKPNINYRSFCSETAQGGEEKLACRIKGVKDIAFLVCRTLEYGSKECGTWITNEVENLLKVKAEGINTVALAPKPSQRIINGVSCAEQPKEIRCTGFLEEWIPKHVGMFQHIRDSIVYGKVPQLIADVKKYTPAGNLKRTANDLVKITAFMQKGKYGQICDLQGFFLKAGGFKVNDPFDIKKGLGYNESCYGGDPTTKQVYDALVDMIDAFRKP